MAAHTKFFPAFHRHLFGRAPVGKARLLARKVREADQLCLTQLHALFAEVLPSWLSCYNASQGTNSRHRIYTPLVTFWALLSQTLDADGSCCRAVTRVQTLCSALKLPLPDEDTGAYCTARARLPMKLLLRLRSHIVGKLAERPHGHPVTTFFLTGACGDINPIYSVRRDLFEQRLGGEIVRCLGQLETITKPSLAIETREFEMPGREHPQFKEAKVARNWPGQLEHYRKSFADMKKREQPSYLYFITGLRIGDDFGIITNADELFCSIGMSIKRQSPFKHTMTVEQVNGAHGYVPSAKGFEGGSYETWFGEHSYLTTKADEIIKRESLEILNRLKRGNKK
ncbi:MAG: hypothetical protein K1X78_24920 [Verrucomicrobiaceae bacterium]|nr:hypothetical protein [Verrucomicrobiaceae bacterium]